MKPGVLPLNINVSTCSYQTKRVITRSADNVNEQSFWNIKVKWTRYSAQTLFLSSCFSFFVTIYRKWRSDEIVNHSWRKQTRNNNNNNNNKTIYSVHPYWFASQAKWQFSKKKWIWSVEVVFALGFQVIFYRNVYKSNII